MTSSSRPTPWRKAVGFGPAARDPDRNVEKNIYNLYILSIKHTRRDAAFHPRFGDLYFNAAPFYEAVDMFWG